MSVKLVFQDGKGNTLYDKDIFYEGLVPLPVSNDVVILPNGKRITIISHETAYSEPQGGATDVQVIFVCTDEVKHTFSKVPVKGA